MTEADPVQIFFLVLRRVKQYRLRPYGRDQEESWEVILTRGPTAKAATRGRKFGLPFP